MKDWSVKNKLKAYLPFWLLRDGAILTFSELAIASVEQNHMDY